MKGLSGVFCGFAASLVLATGARAQTTPDANWARTQELATLNASHARVETAALNQQATARLNNQTTAAAGLLDPAFDAPSVSLNQGAAFTAAQDQAFGGAIDFQNPDGFDGQALSSTGFAPNAPGRFDGVAAIQRSDVWFDTPGHSDRLRLTTHGILRRADGAPLPVTPRDRDAFDVDAYDVSFTRGWPVARGYTASGLEVTLIPHAGFGMGDEGGSAEAGATLKIGDNLDRLAPDGRARFGDRARWYLYAAGSGRAVGYNFARTRDGDYARSGISQDKGSFLGDASIGVAYRRGAMQGSFGVVYRELKAEGMRGGDGIDRDVSEGLVAFQLSIRPQW